MSEESDQEREMLKRIVNKAADEIIEHVYTVQIFVTKHRGNTSSTISYEHGRGCFYARCGLIQEWLVMQEQYQKQEAIRRDNENQM